MKEAGVRFEDRAVVVTGGASGQGRRACELFAAEGAKVVVADWNEAGAAEVADRIGGAACKVDVSREDEVKAMVEGARSRFGRLDVLCNNAGVGYSESGRFPMASVVDTPEEAWDAILAINLKGAAMGCKHAIPLMVEQGGGVIVNTSSINGLCAMSGADAYTAAKGGIIALTRVLASDWGAKGVRVNCVCPGAVDTPMVAPALADPAIQAHFQANCPLERVAEAEEIARVVLFLASDDASYVNGAILPVDGGWTAR